MKTCPVCELESPEDYQYCPEDGSSFWALEPQVATITVSEGDETRLDSTPLNESTAAPVLYCPSCASVYPLTFTSCPMHGTQLTTRRVERSVECPSNRESELITHDALRPEDQEPVTDHRLRVSVQTFSNENPNTPDDECDQASIPSSAPRAASKVGGAIARAARLEFFKSGGVSASESGSRQEIRSQRIAAVVLVIGLCVFAVIAFKVISAIIERRRNPRISIKPPSRPPDINIPPVAKVDDPPAPIPNTPDRSLPGGGGDKKPGPNKPQPTDNPRRPGIAVSRFGASVIPFKKRNALSLVFDISLKKFTERKPHIVSVSMKPRSAKWKGNALKLPFPRALRFDAKGNTQWNSTVTIPAFKEIDWRGGAKIVVLYYSYDSSDIQEASFATNVTFQSRASHGRRADNRSSDTKMRRRSVAVGTL
jgi:hypothetical protein